ncbi:MAG TPA: tRNA pseudouridine(13) synthase TruD [Polyangiaceae bacterium]|nr:tRNA pseudouridine(13) synthase TruD [Polyangiaceae bacterium]
MSNDRPLEPPAPYPELAGTGGQLGSEVEDFVVDEVLDREPQGSGDHRLVRFRKTGLTTREAVMRIAKAASVRDRDVGTAGMKDKHAVTSQWLSLPARSTPPSEWQPIEDVEILEHVLDRTKLRTGQLAGNRFRVRLVGLSSPRGSEELRAKIHNQGLLNIFGSQRFGVGGDNLSQALQWLRDGAKRRLSRFELKFYPSVVQSEIFNRYALLRQAEGLARLIAGDVVRLSGVRSVFVVEDPEKEQSRLESGDIFLTGPIVGPKMRAPAARALELEREVLRSLDIDETILGHLSRHAPGTRRDLVVMPTDLSFNEEPNASAILEFFLPAGSYATEVIRAFTKQPFFLRQRPSGLSHE